MSAEKAESVVELQSLVNALREGMQHWRERALETEQVLVWVERNKMPVSFHFDDNECPCWELTMDRGHRVSYHHGYTLKQAVEAAMKGGAK